MKRICQNWEGGMTVGDMKITNLRYAYDNTLLVANRHASVPRPNGVDQRRDGTFYKEIQDQGYGSG